MPLKREPVVVMALVDEVLGLVESEARGAGIAVVREIPSGLPVLQADRDRIKQVLLNLVFNAIQAMPSGGTLAIGAVAAGGR